MVLGFGVGPMSRVGVGSMVAGRPKATDRAKAGAGKEMVRESNRTFRKREAGSNLSGAIPAVGTVEQHGAALRMQRMRHSDGAAQKRTQVMQPTRLLEAESKQG